MRVLRAALAFWLVLALALGPATIGGAVAGEGSMPCQMEMATLDQQALPEELPDSSHQKMPPACPMMTGGLCMTLLAVAPGLVSLPIPDDSNARAIPLDESVTPRVVSPLRRPPRSL